MPELEKSWRHKPGAILPLVFLLSFALGLTENSLDPLLRLIHCDGFKEKHPGMIFIPELDVCTLPMLQKLLSRDMTAFSAISTISSVLLFGFYGRLLDQKGRRYIMLVAAAAITVGDAWLLLAASNEPLRSSLSIYFSALLRGLGGSFVAMNAAHYAFITDVSQNASRSFILGLTFIMWWMGGGLSNIVGTLTTQYGSPADTLATAVVTWISYILYVVLVVPETHQGTDEGQKSANNVTEEQAAQDTTISAVHQYNIQAALSVIWEPLPLVFGHPVLRWLCMASFALHFAEGSLDLLTPYCDHVLGLEVMEMSLISVGMTISRAVSLLVLLPLFTVSYPRLALETKIPGIEVREATERTPLLSEEIQTETTQAEDNGIAEKTRAIAKTAAQELIICRTGLLLGAGGMFLTWCSRNWIEIGGSMAIVALGAATAPSLWSLITLAAVPSKMGRVLTGVCAFNTAAMALGRPAFRAVYHARLERTLGCIWIFASSMLAACMIVMFILRPQPFVVTAS